jgi:hypothetical protein
MSESDFMDITRNGKLCNADGEIGSREFETIMRKEVMTYLQTRLTDFTVFRTPEDIEFTQLGAVKTILSEVLILVEEQRAARKEMKDALEQIKQGLPEDPDPLKAAPLRQPLSENGVCSSTPKVANGADAAKALQAGMEALAAELVGVKTVIQEHAAELRRTFSVPLPLPAQRPCVSSPVRSIAASLEASGLLSERRRRPPRRDWGSFVLAAGPGSGRNTTSNTTSAGVSPAAPAGSLVRAVPPIKIPESPARAADRHAGQDYPIWSSPYPSRMANGNAVVTVAALRRDGEIRGGKKPAAVAPGADADRKQLWGAASNAPTAAPAPLEISAPTLLPADIGAAPLALAYASPAPSTDALHQHQPAVSREAVPQAASPVLKGESRHRQVESEVVLVPCPADCSSPAAVCNGGHDDDEPFHCHHGPERVKQPPSSDAAAAGGGGRMSPGIDGLEVGAAKAWIQQPWVESELGVPASSGDRRPAAVVHGAPPPLWSGGDAAATLPSIATPRQAIGAVIRLPSQGPSAFQPPARRRAPADGTVPQLSVASANGLLKPSLRRLAEPMMLPPSP